ncbi:MAG: hypothetical protein VKS61_18390 [Candidatus Sericytochromatia bacterium]|nr:hypothetical protein [Candidatus Sericytochromatia bacterium]
MTRRWVVLAVIAGLPGLAEAAVEEDPVALQRRLDAFQERRLIIEGTPGPSPSASPGQPTPSPSPLVLRQGAERIYHVDFVELMDDPSLTRDWEAQRARDWAWWAGTGLVGVPLGGALFVQNFRGEGPLALFASAGGQGGANAGDWRAFSLSLIGAGLALYGGYNMGLWLGENLDLHHPDRLEAVSILSRVREWNDRLVEHYGLEPATLPPAPTPRPSTTPTPPPAYPFAEPSPVAMASPFQPGPPADLPYGVDVPVMPTPLPLASPGALLAPAAGPTGGPTPERPAFFGPAPSASP